MTNPQSYFQVAIDFNLYADQWFLGDPLDERHVGIHSRKFASGTPYSGPAPRTVPVREAGNEVCVSLATSNMPIVSTAVAEAIRKLAADDVEFFPVDIVAARDSYEIINVIVEADCLDEKKSEFTRWTECDGRPEMLGRYRSVPVMHIDLKRAGNHHLLRLSGWSVSLIVSDAIKLELEKFPDLGVQFQPVS